MTSPSTAAAVTAEPPIHCYIYYRVRADIDPQLVQATVCAMQATLARRTGISGRLLRRAEDAGTWMEIYEGIRNWTEFAAALDDELAAHRITDLLEPGGARHRERFIAIA